MSSCVPAHSLPEVGRPSQLIPARGQTWNLTITPVGRLNFTGCKSCRKKFKTKQWRVRKSAPFCFIQKNLECPSAFQATFECGKCFRADVVFDAFGVHLRNFFRNTKRM